MKNDKGSVRASLMVIALCVSMALSFVFVVPVSFANGGSQGADGTIWYDAWGNKYYHDTFTWGDSTEVSAEIKIPFNFGKPDMCYSWCWDTQAAAGDEAYADNEMFWIDRSTWTNYTDIAVDSRSLMSIVREEHVVTDGAEDGVIVDFVLVQFNH